MTYPAANPEWVDTIDSIVEAVDWIDVSQPAEVRASQANIASPIIMIDALAIPELAKQQATECLPIRRKEFAQLLFAQALELAVGKPDAIEPLKKTIADRANAASARYSTFGFDQDIEYIDVCSTSFRDQAGRFVGRIATIDIYDKDISRLYVVSQTAPYPDGPLCYDASTIVTAASHPVIEAAAQFFIEEQGDPLAFNRLQAIFDRYTAGWPYTMPEVRVLFADYIEQGHENVIFEYVTCQQERAAAYLRGLQQQAEQPSIISASVADLVECRDLAWRLTA